MKMRTITCFGDRTSATLLTPPLDEDNLVTRTGNFVNVNIFNSVTSPRVLSYRVAFCTIS